MQITDSRWLIYKPDPLFDVVRGALLNALAYAEGNQSFAAKLLGISDRVMNYKLAQYDIPSAKGSPAMRAEIQRQRYPVDQKRRRR